MSHTCICGKQFESLNGLKTHQRACLEFHKDSDPFICECGKEFKTPALRSSHIKYCNIYCNNHNKKIRDPKNDKNNFKRGWSRGKTINDPIYGNSIKKISERSKKYYEDHEEEIKSRLDRMAKSRTEETFKKQSTSRKRRYEDGSLKPAIGIGRGDTCCLIYQDKEYWFRSSYEFIFGLYLCYSGKNFEYENIRISKNGKTYFNDFYVDGLVIEIKGFQTSKDQIEREVFESEGYNFKLITYKEIEKLKDELKEFVNIDDILIEIHKKSKERNYFKYIFNQIK